MPPPWTPELVADRLVAAFRASRGRPVMTRGRGFAIDDVEVEPFGWPERYLQDTHERRVVLTWARCKATGESIRELYRHLDWSRSAAERRRLVALAAIARGLNAERSVTET